MSGLVLTRSRVWSECHIRNYLLTLFYLFIYFFTENNKFEITKTLYEPLNYADFFCSVLKQMPLFPMIHSVLIKVSFLVPGIRFLLVVLKKQEEAGGMTAVLLNVLFRQISMAFIHVVEMKPWPLSTGESQILLMPREALQNQLK